MRGLELKIVIFQISLYHLKNIYIFALSKIFLIILFICYSYSTSHFHFSNIRQFVRLRCQIFPCDQKIDYKSDIKPVLWSYKGQLVDPRRGMTIASVEGLELVRFKSEYFNKHSNPMNNYNNNDNLSCLSTKRNLENFTDSIKSMLCSDLSWDYAASIESRKLFCYRVKESSSHLFSYIKRKTLSPHNRLTDNQKIVSYNITTTFISRDNGKELLLHAEWPKEYGGHWVLSRADGFSENYAGSDVWNGINSVKNKNIFLDFSTSVSFEGSNADDHPILPPLKSSQSTCVPNLPRSQFVQFGQARKQNKFSYVRESYSYSMDKVPVSTIFCCNSRHPVFILRFLICKIRYSLLFKHFFSYYSSSPILSNSSMRYTRYGEAPPWYGLKRVAILELQGRPIRFISCAPPFAASLASRIGIDHTSNSIGISAKEIHCGSTDKIISGSRYKMKLRYFEKACNKIWNLVQKVQSASTHTTIPVC